MIFAPGGDFIPAKNAGGELFMANIAPRASFFQEFLEFFLSWGVPTGHQR